MTTLFVVLADQATQAGRIHRHLQIRALESNALITLIVPEPASFFSTSPQIFCCMGKPKRMGGWYVVF
jgi:hypothetical protein